jgi:hypothetical protein
MRGVVYKCAGCRRKFTVRLGTIFEDSRIPLHKWLLAVHLLCITREGLNAAELQRELGLGSYRSALFLRYRIEWALQAQAPRTHRRMQIPLDTDQAMSLLLCVKPTPSMPRPGAHRQKSVWSEVEAEEHGPHEPRKS